MICQGHPSGQIWAPCQMIWLRNQWQLLLLFVPNLLVFCRLVALLLMPSLTLFFVSWSGGQIGIQGMFGQKTDYSKVYLVQGEVWAGLPLAQVGRRGRPVRCKVQFLLINIALLSPCLHPGGGSYSPCRACRASFPTWTSSKEQANNHCLSKPWPFEPCNVCASFSLLLRH